MSKPQRELVLQDAPTTAFARPGTRVPPAFALKFASDVGALAGHRRGQSTAQIKITARAFPMSAAEKQNRAGVVQVGLVLNLSILSTLFARYVIEFDIQRL